MQYAFLLEIYEPYKTLTKVSCSWWLINCTHISTLTLTLFSSKDFPTVSSSSEICKGRLHVVVHFYPWFQFDFLLFESHHHKLTYLRTTLPQILFQPSIKFNHNREERAIFWKGKTVFNCICKTQNVFPCMNVLYTRWMNGVSSCCVIDASHLYSHCLYVPSLHWSQSRGFPWAICFNASYKVDSCQQGLEPPYALLAPQW